MFERLIPYLRERMAVVRFGNRARRLARIDVEAAWPWIERILAASRSVNDGLVGASATLTIQHELIRRILEMGEIGEGLLARHTNHPNPVVAAYCITALRWLDSPYLEGINGFVESRDEVVMVRSGCLGLQISLRELANLHSMHGRT